MSVAGAELRRKIVRNRNFGFEFRLQPIFDFSKARAEFQLQISASNFGCRGGGRKGDPLPRGPEVAAKLVLDDMRYRFVNLAAGSHRGSKKRPLLGNGRGLMFAISILVLFECQCSAILRGPDFVSCGN